MKKLASAIASLNEKYGSGTVQNLTEGVRLPLERILTGIDGLDDILGGGLPRGRIVEIFGPESSGKSTIATHILAHAQSLGHKVALIDVEHGFNDEFAKSFGLDLGALLFSQPDTGEQAFEIIEELANSGEVAIIVVDSVAALLPLAELENEIGQPGIGLQARLMSHGMRKLVGILDKTKTILIFINQIRMAIGVYGNPEITPGGRALKFYASIRLDLRRKENLSRSSEGIIGIKIKAKVIKNKVAPPLKEKILHLYFKGKITTPGKKEEEE